jgi:dynein heavy chain
MDTIISPGMKDLRWQNTNINVFIKETMLVVKDVNNLVNTMKNNLEKIEKILKDWAKKPLIERKSKPMVPEDFIQQHLALVSAKHNEITLQGKEIGKIIKDTNDHLKANKSSKEWKAYVDYVNEIIIEGLAHVIKSSMD